eukprot:COSAG03_NODE_3194_length_2151_cov_2.395224_3_plen_131_part_01
MKPDNLIFELRVCNLPCRYQAEKFFLFEKIDRLFAAPSASSVPCLAPHPAKHASNTGRGSGVGHVASADHIESGAYVPFRSALVRGVSASSTGAERERLRQGFCLSLSPRNLRSACCICKGGGGGGGGGGG